MVEPISMSIAIASLVSSAPHWFRAIENSALNQGKDFAFGEGKKRFQNYLDERKHTQNIQLALENAAERGLKQFTTLEERDHYRDVLQVLSEGNSEALRREAVRQLSLSDEPDYKALSEKYNLSQRIAALADKTTHDDVDATPYLKSFFDALLIELYNDPLFRAQMSDLVRVRAAMSGQRSLDDILSTLRQLYDMFDNSYSSEQFQQEVDAYLKFVEGRFRNHKLVMGVVLSRDEERSPELDRIFVPLRIEMDARSTRDTRDTKQDNRKDILALLDQYSYLVLLGGPGSGKSTTTRYLTWQHAKVHTIPELASPQNTKVLSGQPVPLHIELRLYNENCKKHPHSFLSYITDVVLKQKDISVSTQMFKALLERRAMLVLFDGLDEVPLSERKRLVEDIEDFAQRYPGNRILVTSRPVGYDLTRFTDRLFEHGHVQDFDDEQILQFIDNWYRHVLKYATIQAEEQQEIDLFYNTLMRNERLHKLAANPLLLTVMTALHRYRRLPDKRVQLYKECADILLDKWAEFKYDETRSQDMKLGKDDQLACLAHLGFVLHSRAQESESYEAKTVQKMREEDMAVDVPESFLLKEIKKFLAEQKLLSGAEQGKEAERFLKLVKVEAGLLVERGTDETGEALYGFVHRTFQEYFAAVDVHSRYESEGDITIISSFLRKHAYDMHWREVVLLLLLKLPHKLVTRQLGQLLNYKSYPKYKDVTQQDIFFVALCLEEEIRVEKDFAEQVLSKIHIIVDSSPSYFQHRKAVGVLIELIRSSLYTDIARKHLDVLINGISTANIMKGVASNRAFEVANIIYRNSPKASEERQKVLNALTKLYKRNDHKDPDNLAISDVNSINSEYLSKYTTRRLSEEFSSSQITISKTNKTFIGAPMYRNEEKAYQKRLRYLISRIKQKEISVLELVHELSYAVRRGERTEISYEKIDFPECREIDQLILQRFRQGNLDIHEQVMLAKTLYMYSPVKSLEEQEGKRLLIELFWQGKLSITERINLANWIRSYTREALEEEQEDEYDGSYLLLERYEQDQESLHLLVELLKQEGLSVTEQIKLVIAICGYYMTHSESNASEYLYALKITGQIIQDVGVPSKQRLEAAIIVISCKTYAGNFSGRLEAIRVIFALLMEEEANFSISQRWYSIGGNQENGYEDVAVNRLHLSSLDIEAIYEMAKMEVLPDNIRDEMYYLLNHIVAVRRVEDDNAWEDEHIG